MIAALSGDETRPFVIVSFLRQIMRGRSNAAGQVALATGTSTSVDFDNCTAGSQVMLSPRDAQAEASNAYVSDIRAKGFTITHAAGTVGRQMGFGIVG